MSDLNVTTLTGRLVRDPVVRYSASGSAWGVFSIASNYYYKDKAGNFQDEAAFVPCKALGRAAETLAKHKKGEMVVVAGRLRTESWEKEGKALSQLVLVCDHLRFVTPQNATTNGTAASGGVRENGTEACEATPKDDQPPF
jgi:single-strand DNA-binding protein